VEGQGTWMARTGWAFVRGARASVFGGGEILLTARQTRLRSGTEGQQEQRDRRQAGAEQGGIQSNNENEHDYLPSRNCVKGSATPLDCPPPCPPRQVLPQQHVQYKYCLYTDSRSRKPHSFTPRTSRLTPHIFQQTRPSRQQIADGPKTLVGTPSKTLPLARPATSCLLVTPPSSVLALVALWCSEDCITGIPSGWAAGAAGTAPPRSTEASQPPRPNPGPPPFAGPQASSAVGPRAVEVLG
jgi:hypothetical protein